MNETNRFVICVDMDGVLCDFNSQFINYNEERLTPIQYQAKYGKTGFYNHFKNTPVSYWSDMTFMPNAKTLINKLNDIVHETKQNNIDCYIVILTTPMPTNNCFIGKTEWVHSNINNLVYDDILINKSLGPKGLYVEYTASKYNISNTRNIILIDDFQKNVDSFNKCGATGILYSDNNVIGCIDKLNYLIFRR